MSLFLFLRKDFSVILVRNRVELLSLINARGTCRYLFSWEPNSIDAASRWEPKKHESLRPLGSPLIPTYNYCQITIAHHRNFCSIIWVARILLLFFKRAPFSITSSVDVVQEIVFWKNTRNLFERNKYSDFSFLSRLNSMSPFCEVNCAISCRERRVMRHPVELVTSLTWQEAGAIAFILFAVATIVSVTL